MNRVKPWAKAAIAIAFAGVVATRAVLTDGITPDEWLQIVLATLTAAGVYLVPNEPQDSQPT